MPFIQHTSKRSKFRVLISGFPNSGKTTSFPTFVYGPYNYWSDEAEEIEKAVKYANNRKMVILVCPGETGTRSLPLPTDNITSYYFETAEGEDVNSVKWSIAALKEFDAITKQVLKEKPDILIVDGLHGLASHIMNRTTGGDFLQGLEIGTENQYAAAKLYSQAHNAFGQYVTALYHEAVPMLVATTWEDWQSGTTEAQKPGAIGDRRYLWPALPGKMAKEIVGKFDARLSAKLFERCCHAKPLGNGKFESLCADHKAAKQHYVWQFLPKGDVQGVGIKGCRQFNSNILEYPYIHQNGDSLLKLIATYS